MADFDAIETLPFITKRRIGAKARIGLVVLASDYTIEQEFRDVLRIIDEPDIALYHARISNAPNVTPDTLAAMGPKVTQTAQRLLPGDDIDVLAYGCTSASFVLGPDRIKSMLLDAKPMAETTNPATAAFAALNALGAKRLAVLTPYRPDVNAFVRRGLQSVGFDVPVFGSFDEETDSVVSEIETESIRAGLHHLTRNCRVDAAFVSCTSIRLLHAISMLEEEFGFPVVSSNQAIAWQCLRFAGYGGQPEGLGRLFTL